MGSGDIQDFYRQKKRGGRSAAGASKSSAGKKQKTHKSSSGKSAGATLGSNTARPPALVSLHLQDDSEKQEDMLRQFDLNMRYGPCMGISRLERWERAQNLGLNPPKDVESLLRGGKVQLECVWDGRV